jgi:DNA-binding transcriptional MerR regulator
VSGRTYLSIGDVLTLLRREFPDVTISKIRFLESQGLVNPERTPSGYRKFYEQDVERLRWVLRQQREHFLPLKVIKGRLAEESSTGEENGHETPRAEHRRAGRVPSPGTGPAGAKAHGRATRVLVRQRPIEPEGRGDEERPGPSNPSITRSVAGPQHRDERHTAQADGEEVAGQELPGFEDRKAARRALPTAALVAGGSPDTSGVLTMAAFSGSSMTLEELAAASGLEVADVSELESYGLVASRSIGGVAYFDEDALTVAHLAGKFAGYGVEARHLRLHLLAVQREAGFIEQIVLPLLKQRNPASRQRAHETVGELSRLGQELRAVLLSKRLREQLGG